MYHNQPLPPTPSGQDIHKRPKADPSENWIGYAVGGLLLVVGFILGIVMFILMSTVSDLTGVRYSPLQMLLGPSLMMINGVLFLILWPNRDRVIEWVEHTFKKAGT